MNETSFLARVIDDRIETARAQYASADDQLKLEGSRAGCDECRGLSPFQILPLLNRARADTILARETPNFEWWRCRELAIEWVANVLSAARYEQGLSQIVPVTLYDATIAAGRILATMPP